jgi:quercetin dioxygenase-like cupin family protein
MEERSNLDHLRELTPTLPGLAGFDQHEVGNVTVLEVEKGPIFMFEILTVEGLTVTHSFLPEGAVLGKHAHPDLYEVFVVVQGEVRVRWEGEEDQVLEKVVGAGQSFYALPSEAHCVEALTDSWVAAVFTSHAWGRKVTTSDQ